MGAPMSDKASTPLPSSEAQKQLSFRIAPQEKSLIERAVRKLGVNMTQFCVRAILEKAEDVLHGAREKRDIDEVTLAFVLRVFRTIEAQIPPNDIEGIRAVVKPLVKQDLIATGLLSPSLQRNVDNERA